MTETQQIKERVATWKRATPTLEEIRRNDIRQLKTKCSIAAFDGLVKIAIKGSSPTAHSGLVEQQKWFAKVIQS